WIIVGAHAVSALGPGFTAVARDPHAAGRDGDGDMTRIMRIDADRVNAGMLRAVRSPVVTFRMIPKRPIQFPRLAVVLGFEKSARHGAAPDHTRLVGSAARHAPDQFE